MSFGTRWTLVTLSVAASLALVARPAVASHSAAGNCKHAHVSSDKRSYSSCNGRGAGPLEGQACTVDGQSGECVQITRGCQCRTTKIDRQVALLLSVHESLESALLYAQLQAAPAAGDTHATPLTGEEEPQLLGALACSQLNVLAASAIFDASALATLGYLRFYDPRLLGKIDEIILWTPTIHGYLLACALANAGQFPPLFEFFVALKTAMIASPHFRAPDEPIFLE